MSQSSQPSLRSVEVANFEALLERLSAELASTAQRYDESGAFPHANFKLLHEHGLVALTVPKALGGGGRPDHQQRCHAADQHGSIPALELGHGGAEPVRRHFVAGAAFHGGAEEIYR